jgi:hypothetical protein
VTVAEVATARARETRVVRGIVAVAGIGIGLLFRC